MTKKPTSGKIIDFSIDDIQAYLEEIKKLILNNKYSVSLRSENDAFMSKYRINTAKIKEIMLNLQYRDFCYAAANRKPEFAYEQLYIFCKEYELDDWGDFETIKIYVKTNLTQLRNGNDFVIIISFHELEKPIRYLFN